MTKAEERPGRFAPFREMRGFTTVWFGQMVSLTGSGMTMFALVVWLFEETGQATSVALLFLASFGPSVALSPLAGVIVDRYDRKVIMLLSDALAAVSSIGLLVLLRMDMLTSWSIYGLTVVGGVFHAFQFPALSAATTMMVPKRHYGRASGMLSTAWAMSDMAAPILAAILLAPVGLSGILIIDLATFVVAVLTLLLVTIPHPKGSKEGEDAKASWKDDITFGWKYILARRSLLGLLMFYFVANLLGTLGIVLVQPMVLARTGNDELVLGMVMGLGGIGGILGGVAMSVWGGPKRRIRGILWGMLIGSGLGGMLMGLNGGVVIWAAGIFFWTVVEATINGSSQAIWQTKVPPDIQGRVFSVRFFMALIGAAPAMLIAGPLADRVFEPLMMDATGPLAWLVGSGPGAGMGLLILITGVLGVVITLIAWSSRSIREIEDLLPDHVAEEDGDEEEGDDGDGDEAGVQGEGLGPSEETAEEGAGEAEELGRPPEQGGHEPGGELDVPLADDDLQ